jgi:NO-binding membrane sensor protein with MHYT domain
MTPELIPASYSPALVLLSFCISAIGAYTALSAAAAAVQRGRHGRLDRFNLVFAGCALGGIAIWSMHFIGMVAWNVEIALGYRILETAVSLVAAVIVSTLALGYIAAAPLSLGRLLVAGPLAGLGVATMHYLGMYSMRFNGYFDWNLPIVVLSVVIAMVAATAALWLAFVTRRRSHRIAASFVMATAVCTMHYTAMAAASVMCTTRTTGTVLVGLLRPADLPLFVVAVSLSVVMMIGLDLLMQRVTGAAVAPQPRR